MPLLDIATAQPCFGNNACSISSRTFFGTRFMHNKEIRLVSSWSLFRVPKKAPLSRTELFRGGLTIRAVATLEKGPATNIQINKEQDDFGGLRMEKYSGGEKSTGLDDREKLRRMRISKANKGNTPWNKGRKHSPETLLRIRERTRIAMQDPKVKMKLVNLGHAQSEETRIKIGVGVKMGWERRRGKLRLQETCHYEWQNLIAEASRRGLMDEEELQWDSYQILNTQLEQEWIQSVEERKKTTRIKGNRRAPKSAEQRRKISEAIAAKWADPEYRTRVRSAMDKYHGVADGVERKPKRKPASDGQIRQKSPPKTKVKEMDNTEKPEPKSQVQRVRLRKKNTPMYKDPLASSKLEMLKSIRAQRAAIDHKKIEAITRAKELIAEAEKAAEALEIAAKRSPVARASLLETRKLISEAIHSIESIDKEAMFTDANNGNLSPLSPEPVRHVEDENDAENGILDGPVKRINGSHAVLPMDSGIDNLEYDHHALQGLLNGKSTIPSSGEYELLGDRHEVYQMISGDISPEELDDMTESATSAHEANGSLRSVSNRFINGSMIEEAPIQPILTTFGSINGSKIRNINGSNLEKTLSQPEVATFGSINGSKVEETPSQPTVATTKKWVRGKLVEVGEGS